jgi:Cu+-exporting ATPase
MFNQTIDPVCGMKVREKKAAATAEYEGERYYFCSLGCQEAFLEDPEKYVTGKVKAHSSAGGCCCCH